MLLKKTYGKYCDVLLGNAIHRYIVDHSNDVLQYYRNTKLHIDAVDRHTKYHDVDTYRCIVTPLVFIPLVHSAFIIILCIKVKRVQGHSLSWHTKALGP